jgi:hypothetical protein
VDFSEARDLFELFFNSGGLFAKLWTVGQFQRNRGGSLQNSRNNRFSDLIFNGKFRGPSPWCGGPRTPLGRRLDGERPERRPCARNLTAVEEKGGGDGGEPHQLQEVVAEGRTWSGNGGEQPAEEVLSGVDVADSGASK